MTDEERRLRQQLADCRDVLRLVGLSLCASCEVGLLDRIDAVLTATGDRPVQGPVGSYAVICRVEPAGGLRMAARVDSLAALARELQTAANLVALAAKGEARRREEAATE